MLLNESECKKLIIHTDPQATGKLSPYLKCIMKILKMETNISSAVLYFF